MPAAIVARSESGFTIQVEIPYGSSMLDAEEVLQHDSTRPAPSPPPRSSSGSTPTARRSRSATPS